MYIQVKRLKDPDDSKQGRQTRTSWQNHQIFLRTPSGTLKNSLSKEWMSCGQTSSQFLSKRRVTSYPPKNKETWDPPKRKKSSTQKCLWWGYVSCQEGKLTEFISSMYEHLAAIDLLDHTCEFSIIFAIKCVVAWHVPAKTESQKSYMDKLRECQRTNLNWGDEISLQLMVNCGFGARWFGIRRIPLWKGLLLKGYPDSNPKTPTQTICWSRAHGKITGLEGSLEIEQSSFHGCLNKLELLKSLKWGGDRYSLLGGSSQVSFQVVSICLFPFRMTIHALWIREKLTA